MAISESQVEHIAKLARLQLSSEETLFYRDNMEKILDYVQQLDALDTENVEPAYHAVTLQDHVRTDLQQVGLSPEDTFKNAPEAERPFFHVPQILSGDQA
jgi:aspartyl-tRNA(Asn)/glutamyl-tRNA(Gln) amidotransferase subunit C